jgi:hypothetical protein
MFVFPGQKYLFMYNIEKLLRNKLFCRNFKFISKD